MYPSMMSWRVLFVTVVVVSARAFPRNSYKRTSSDVIDQIISEGYPAEVHHVTTSDGYILAVHRIPYGKAGPSEERRPIVFLMHGLMGRSSNFIYLGQENGIAYNLADAGFDVWLGNARGSIDSRQHISLNPDDPREKLDFFDFTWEEIAILDVPAMVDFALAVTGEKAVHYIGHSQGGTTFLVLNSLRPEYNKKFVSAHLLAGIGYQTNFPDTRLRATSLLTKSLYALGVSLGQVEISEFPDLPFRLSSQGYKPSDFCFGNVIYKHFCYFLGLDEILGESTDPGVGGAALKQFAHYGQNIKDRAFRRWDHGIVGNYRTYGSLSPPSYNLSLITIPTVMHYGASDRLLNEQDVLAMAAAMPEVEARKVERETFTHSDFVEAVDLKELVTDYIILKMRLAESNFISK